MIAARIATTSWLLVRNAKPSHNPISIPPRSPFLFQVVGARTNIQEGAILHADPGFPARLGEGVTVGHGAIVHGAVVGGVYGSVPARAASGVRAAATG